ncbi:condensation domain-containing protein [Streptomyces sp. NPDC001858]
MTPARGSGQDRPEPVTAGQAAMFLASQKDLTGTSFTTEFTASVEGPLDRARITAAARALTAATPSLRLRMTIDEWTGHVVQSFSDEPPEIDWHTAAEEDVPALLADALRQPVETDDGPLVRLVSAKHGAAGHSVALIIHHLAMDGLSQIPLLHRLGLALAGRPRHEPEERYRQAVRWIRKAEEEAGRADRDHWRERVPSDLVLPEWDAPECRGADRNAAVPARQGAQRGMVPASSVRRLTSTAARTGVRMSHLLTAAVQHATPVRPGGPMAVCNAVSVRPRSGELADVIGCFINEVPLMGQVRPGSSILDTARAHGHRWREDLRRRSFPFAELATRVTRSSRGDTAELDSIVVSYRQLPRTIDWKEGDLRFSSSLYQRYPAAKTEIAVRFFHDGDSLEYEVQWGRNLPEGVGEHFSVRLGAVLRGV